MFFDVTAEYRLLPLTKALTLSFKVVEDASQAKSCNLPDIGKFERSCFLAKNSVDSASLDEWVTTIVQEAIESGQNEGQSGTLTRFRSDNDEQCSVQWTNSPRANRELTVTWTIRHV